MIVQNCFPRCSLCFLMVLLYRPSWGAWKGLNFDANCTLDDRIIIGDAVVTYSDVTAVSCSWYCASKFPCSFFVYNAAARACMLCSLCGNISFVPASGYRFFSAIYDPVYSADGGPSICPSGTLTPLKCWKHISGGLMHVSVGPAGVFGDNVHHNIYYRDATYQDPSASGSSWPMLDGLLVQLDVGSDIVWGVNTHNNIYYRSGITSSTPKGVNWIPFGGDLKWVSVSPGGSVWAVHENGQLLHHRDSSNAQPTGTEWDVIATDMQRVDAGYAGVWVLDTSGHLFHRNGTFGDDGSTGTNWIPVEGTFSSVSSGRNLVVVINSAGNIWLRTGVGLDTPAGLGWLRLPGSMTQIDIFETDRLVALWGVNFADKIYFYVLKD